MNNVFVPSKACFQMVPKRVVDWLTWSITLSILTQREAVFYVTLDLSTCHNGLPKDHI